MNYALVLVGVACVIASLAHGYLGHTRLIAPATFPNRQARGFVVMIWQFSTVMWAMSGVVIAASPWLFNDVDRPLCIAAACAPIVYGVVGNCYVSRGRHFGWMLFAIIIALALVLGALSVVR